MLFRMLLALWLAVPPTLAWGQALGVYGDQKVPAGGASAPSLVRKVAGSSDTATVVSSIAASSVQVTAGDLMVVVCRWSNGGSGLSTASVSDTGGDTFTATASAASFNANNALQMFYAKNAAGQSSSGSVTCNFPTNAEYADVLEVEYSGASTTGPLDQAKNNAGSLSGGSIATSNFTTAYANEIGVCGYTANSVGNSFTPGSSFTQQLTSSAPLAGIADRTFTSPTTTNGQVTAANGSLGEIACATFH